jgi:hypothetical protein
MIECPDFDESQDDEDTSSLNEDDNYNDADKVEEAIRRLEKHVTISGSASRPSASQPNSLAGSQPGSQPHSQPGWSVPWVPHSCSKSSLSRTVRTMLAYIRCATPKIFRRSRISRPQSILAAMLILHLLMLGRACRILQTTTCSSPAPRISPTSSAPVARIPATR